MKKKKLCAALAAMVMATAAFAAKPKSSAKPPKIPSYLEVWQYESNVIVSSTREKDRIPADLVIPDGVTHIMQRAFEECWSLVSVTIPESVIEIGSSAFEGCGSLESVTIPGSVTAIGNSAFEYCRSLREIQFGGTVAQWNAFGGVRVESYCIVHCSDGNIGVKGVPEYLKMEGAKVTGYTGKVPVELVIPAGVAAIGYEAFNGCNSLESVSIPGSVMEIGHKAFKGCSYLERVTIAEGVHRICGGAFADCTSLRSVSISGSVKEIGDGAYGGAFEGCLSLESVTIAEGVEKIGYSAFKGCTSLKSVTIPDGVTKINNDAFKDCTSLASVAIPNSVKEIGDSAFNSTYLKEVQFGGTMAQWNAIEGIGNVRVTCVLCSNGYIGIKGVPEYLEMVGTAVWGYTGKVPANLVIPEGVTGIGGAFKNCTSLVSVTIPDSITAIGGGAFEGCTNLKNVTIPRSVTGIYGKAFNGCTSLVNVVIPRSVTEIGQYAFSKCNPNLKVQYDGTKAQWEAISKSEHLLPKTIGSFTVQCTDGEVVVK